MMVEFYYASFAPVSGNRLDVAEGLLESLRRFGARIDVDVFELRLTETGFEYTYEEIESLSIYEALDKTKGWDGLEFHFTLFERGCSIMLLSELPGKTTAVFTEPKRLFEDQLESAGDAAGLLGLLAEATVLIGVDFCVFEPGWTGRSRTDSDVEGWVNDCAAGRERDWEFVILNEGVWSRSRVMEAIGGAYRAIVLSSSLWVAAKIGRLPFAKPDGQPD
jgi:hypothetical protein